MERIDAASVHVRLDSGRSVAIPRSERLHLDHAYAVTSHSSQGQTAERVLVHIDTDGLSDWSIDDSRTWPYPEVEWTRKSIRTTAAVF